MGKPIGIIGSIWLVEKVGLGRLPEHVRWTHIIGMGLVGGIGFTISLFIAELAFRGKGGAEARLAVLIASAIAAVVGSAFFLLAVEEPPSNESNSTQET